MRIAPALEPPTVASGETVVRARHPRTGAFAPAVVVKTGWMIGNHFLDLRFADGEIFRFAADYLEWLDQLATQREAYWARQQATVGDAIERAFGPPYGELASRIRSHTLSGPMRPSAEAVARGDDASPEELGPFLAKYHEEGHRLTSTTVISGFQRHGEIYLNEAFPAFNLGTRTHETLHALSQPFLASCYRRGYAQLVEGITELMTRIAVAAFMAPSERRNIYTSPVAFAQQGRDGSRRRRIGGWLARQSTSIPRPRPRALTATAHDG